MNKVNRWLGIQCFKHDGNLYRYWDRGFVLVDDNDYIIIAAKRAKVVECNGRKWFTKEPAVTVFSKKEWWNAICMIKNDGICYYCNIASPSIIDRSSIKYIDYDLDTKLFPSGDIKVLDEKEYIHHKKSYGYSDDLDVVLRYTTQEVIKKMQNREFPFIDDEIIKLYNQYLEKTKKQNN